MTVGYDVAVVGAGPAGMAVAETTARAGARTLLIDEQAGPGGQIYRNIESPALSDCAVLGPEYQRGAVLTQALSSTEGLERLYETTVWQVTGANEIGLSGGGAAQLVSAKQIILATGARERPFPIPGWDLNGVMTAGAAQILLKSAALIARDAIFVGCGPLLYLTAYQYLLAGAAPRVVLDTTPGANYWAAMRHLVAAWGSAGHLLKGYRWIKALERAGVAVVRHVDDLRLSRGQTALKVEYTRRDRRQTLDADRVFLHQGVIPDVNLTMAAGLEHDWDTAQLCWRVKSDDWGRTSAHAIAIAGDVGGIAGALAAEHRGTITALGALQRLGFLNKAERDRRAAPARAAYRRELRWRPFHDALFRAPKQFRVPKDDATIVCRCEEVTVGQLRAAVTLGCTGPNQLKSHSRCGMGPCQGRLCGQTVCELIAEQLGMEVSEVGYYRLRPPIKPVLLGELAALDLSGVSSADRDH